MDKAAVLDKLNAILRHEWKGVAQYAQFGFMVTGQMRQVYGPMFHASAEESFGHAKLIGEKIAALGGVPTIQRGEVSQAGELEEMLKLSLEFEQGAVDLYTEALELAEGDRALVVFIEDILVQEQEGVDDLTKILRKPAAAKVGATSAGAKSAAG